MFRFKEHDLKIISGAKKKTNNKTFAHTAQPLSEAKLIVMKPCPAVEARSGLTGFKLLSTLLCSNTSQENTTELLAVQEGLYLCRHTKLQGVILRCDPIQIFQETEGKSKNGSKLISAL